MIRILLVEDRELIRSGLKALLETQPDLQIVGEADNGQRAIQQLEVLHTQFLPPDIVLMDIQMPIMDGVQATQHICQKYPETKILILTTFNDTQYIAEAIRYGAKGYVLKDTPTAELIEAIHCIYKGYTQFGPGILEKMVAQVSAPKPNKLELPPGMTELTSREREVLLLIAKGSSNREIAQTLFLSEGTVRNHITHILARLNLRDRTQAALVANSFLAWLENSGSSESID
ncbi:response regulator transcription factor [Microcoleus sp. ARI1-B5]|uniref:response regulator transcription factor n=1 Tax=unclassified Microcoleus TaxID=2642155 RepID=UPI002FCE99A2